MPRKAKATPDITARNLSIPPVVTSDPPIAIVLMSIRVIKKTNIA